MSLVEWAWYGGFRTFVSSSSECSLLVSDCSAPLPHRMIGLRSSKEGHVALKKAVGPRERLLATAQSLFYSRGAAVGVDALLKEANVARRSLYEHFGGKDGLVTAVLQRASEEDLAWYESALAGAAEPRDRLLGLFDRLDELVSNDGFRGC